MSQDRVDLSDGASVQASLGTQWVELEEDSIVLDVLTDRVFRLNATAAFVWGLLQEPRCVSDIEAALSSAYGLDAAEAKEATRALLVDLIGKGLVGTQGENVVKSGESENPE